jgi:hypothetical protein
MQNSETEPFYKNIKRLSSKNAFRAAARAFWAPWQPRGTRHFTQKSGIFTATPAFQALAAAIFRENRQTAF